MKNAENRAGRPGSPQENTQKRIKNRYRNYTKLDLELLKKIQSQNSDRLIAGLAGMVRKSLLGERGIR